MRRPSLASRAAPWVAALRRLGDGAPPHGWAIPPALAWRTAREARRDGVLGMAAEVAFWALLSLPPLALALLGAVGYLAGWFGPDAVTAIQSSIVGVSRQILTPRAVDEVVSPLVRQMLLGGRGDLASAGFVISLWSGSAAMYRYIRAITVAYDLDGLRGVWRTRLLAFVLNLAGLALGIVVLPLLVLGPDALAGAVPSAVTAETAAAVRVAYWPAVAVLSVAGLTTLYHVGVPVRTPWRRDLPGAMVAMLLWVGGSLVLRTYLTSGLRETDYGPLGAPIAALLFLYVAALAVLAGAELNAEIDKLWPVESTTRGRERAHAAARGDRY